MILTHGAIVVLLVGLTTGFAINKKTKLGITLSDLQANSDSQLPQLFNRKKRHINGLETAQKFFKGRLHLGLHSFLPFPPSHHGPRPGDFTPPFSQPYGHHGWNNNIGGMQHNFGESQENFSGLHHSFGGPHQSFGGPHGGFGHQHGHGCGHHHHHHGPFDSSESKPATEKYPSNGVSEENSAVPETSSQPVYDIDVRLGQGHAST